MDRETVKRMAMLARIEIKETELEFYETALEKILNLTQKMTDINTEGVEPMSHPYADVQPLRADIVTEENQRELLQSMAPKTLAGLYLVPQVIE